MCWDDTQRPLFNLGIKAQPAEKYLIWCSVESLSLFLQDEEVDITFWLHYKD